LVNELGNVYATKRVALEHVIDQCLKAILVVYFGHFVIAPQHHELGWIKQLHCKQVQDNFHRLWTTIHIVTEENESMIFILGVGDEMLYSKEITTNCLH